MLAPYCVQCAGHVLACNNRKCIFTPAQAALGSFFCQLPASSRTAKVLVVETHSDHLMDRVRMEVRDGRSGLKPEDVSILFFEREQLDVRIHSLRIDK